MLGMLVMLQCLPAAAVLGQMSFKSAMKHKAIVAKVATGAAARGRSPLLGVLFDELARRVAQCILFCVNMCYDPALAGSIGKANLERWVRNLMLNQ
jgi:hypothetical protein